MTTLSSLPAPALGDLSSRYATTADARTFAPVDELQTLHVSLDAQPRALDDIERDFLAALCECRPD